MDQISTPLPTRPATASSGSAPGPKASTLSIIRQIARLYSPDPVPLYLN